jgi:hypothetical protein
MVFIFIILECLRKTKASFRIAESLSMIQDGCLTNRLKTCQLTVGL